MGCNSGAQRFQWMTEEINRLTKDNEQLKVERDELQQNVCGDCLEYKDDGTPRTSYGWNENAVEGQIPCGCISESGPYQVLEAECNRLQEWQSLAFAVQPNIDLEIEALNNKEGERE